MTLGLALSAALATFVFCCGPGDGRPLSDRPGVRSARSSRAAIVGVGLATGILTGSLLVSVLIAGGAVAWTPLQKARTAARVRSELTEAVPETVEIVTLAISAGMMIDDAFGLVVQCGPRAVRAAFTGALARLGAGSTRREVITGIPLVAGPGFTPMAQVLLAAERDGAPVALVLDRLAGEAMVAHRHAARERAGRVPVLLLAPLLACSLPAVLIGTIVPFVIVTLGQTSF